MATPRTEEPETYPEIAFDKTWREELKRVRKLAPLITQAELADAVGVTQSTIHHIEDGKVSSSDAVIPIVRHLGKRGLQMPSILFDSEVMRRWVTAGVRLLADNEKAFRAILASAEVFVADLDAKE